MEALIQRTHPSWHKLLQQALSLMDQKYLQELWQAPEGRWFPGRHKLFAAFAEPLDKLAYVLLGESPYPRAVSANGYAFWDNAVQDIWSVTGLSREVNRATSLRNFIKMLLVARGDLVRDTSQMAIAALDKSVYCQTIRELFEALIRQGFLLLNATLVYSPRHVPYHARHWRVFINFILQQLNCLMPRTQLLLFGKIAAKVDGIVQAKVLRAEHPYNISFITNPEILAFFKPLHLLERTS